MTPDRTIVSVPHSGTRFLKERLGIETHVHTNCNWNALWERVHNKEIIVPLRSPDAVWRSWCRRRNHPDIGKWVASYFISWGMMHTLDQLLELDFICVDKANDPRIDNWERIGDKDESVAGWKLHNIDLRPIYKIPLVQRHYGSWQ